MQTYYYVALLHPCKLVQCHYFNTFHSAAVFALEREEYFVDETAGVARIGVVKKSGSIDAGQSITVVVTPTEGTDPNQGAGMCECARKHFHCHHQTGAVFCSCVIIIQLLQLFVPAVI